VRLRVRFSKLGKVRWISHRDIARCVERAVRRAKLPVAYSEGFSPRPRISFGLALPTGAESLAEYLDIDFAANDVDFASVGVALTAGLPVGIDVTATAPLPAGAMSLQEGVVASRWELGLFGEPMPDGWFADAAARLLAADELVVTRERKGEMATDRAERRGPPRRDPDSRGGTLDLPAAHPARGPGSRTGNSCDAPRRASHPSMDCAIRRAYRATAAR
jgi:radical SAM-linked protein